MESHHIDSYTCFTSVLSQNLFESLSLGRLAKLTKVSLSHNLLRTVPNTEVQYMLLSCRLICACDQQPDCHFLSIQHLLELKEVRLNDNKISDIPDSLQLNSRYVASVCFQGAVAVTILILLHRLTLLDLGNNHLKDIR